MGASNKTHHLVRFSSGEIWCFSFDYNRGIIIKRLGRDGIWKPLYDLIPDAHEDFFVNIDDKDRLHLICCSKKGELLYMLYTGTEWSKQVLSIFEPALYTIRYPMVIPSGSKIHILFAIGKAFNTGYWSLQHYYREKSEWHASEITKITSGYRLSPFYTDLSEKYLHLTYRSLTGDKYQIFYCRYHIEHNIWSSPENVTYDSNDCNMPSILIRDDILHLAWTSLHRNDLIVKYKNRPVRNEGKTGWSPEIQLNSQGTNAALPRLIWAGGKVWCIWHQNDILYASSSEDQGKNWSAPAELSDVTGIGFQYIHYSSNYPKDKECIQLQWTYGSAKDGLLLPVAGEDMDLPGYNASAAIREIKDQGFKEKTPYRSIHSALDRETAPVMAAPHRKLENILLDEFDRQEELYHSLISKMDESSELGRRIIDENKQIMVCIRENTEMLQSLKEDMEQIKQYAKQLKSEGLLRRFFYRGS